MEEVDILLFTWVVEDRWRMGGGQGGDMRRGVETPPDLVEEGGEWRSIWEWDRLRLPKFGALLEMTG
jgi:hypothetical protein